MNGTETIAFSVLWVFFLALAGLVILLYRQVENAYRVAGANLERVVPGDELPRVEVMTKTGAENWAPDGEGQLTAFIFVTTECAQCVKLLRSLKEAHELPCRVVLLVDGEERREFAKVRDARFAERWLTASLLAIRDYGYPSVPYAYIARSTRLLVSGSVRSLRDLKTMTERANENEGLLGATIDATARA